LSDQDFAVRLPFRILVAEDNPVNQKLSLLLLSRLGYRADLAGNGLEVLQSLARQSYDLIFMDMHMPKMDGLDATERVRQMYPAGGGPWIIALTANAMQSDRENCLAAGMQDFLSKPIQMHDLRSALERVPRAWSVPDYLAEIIAEDPGIAKELLTLYLDDATQNLHDLNEQVLLRDEAVIARILHSLKGSSRQIGALKLSDIAESMEREMVERGFAAISENLAYLETAFELVRFEIGKKVTSLTVGGLLSHA
jgi:CheY-like chemotaxis protein